jgi:DNA processing protein
MPPLSRFTLSENPEEFTAAQRLASAQLPPTRLRSLLEVTDNSPSAIFQLTRDRLRHAPCSLTEKQVDRLYDAAKTAQPRDWERHAVALAVTVVTARDPTYPNSLLPLADAPPLVFVRGDLSVAAGTLVAIVGSRRASAYGRNQTERFARAFAATGSVLVSGGAAGIDTVAHKSALDAGGKTIAILGCGVDHAYPAENRGLFAQIAEGYGAVISEYPLGTTPEPWRFPARNRIIAALARVTVVIESPSDSGALITARCAAEYGRSVYAVPGDVDSGRSRGCHELIRDGAFIADRPEDVLLGLGLLPGSRALSEEEAIAIEVPPKTPLRSVPQPQDIPTSNRPMVLLSPDEERLLAQMPLTPVHLDEISAAAGLSASQAGVAATLLEMKEQIRRLPGNLFVRMP